MIETVTLVATVPAIVALTNVGKRLGVPDRAAVVLAVVLGVGLSVAQFYLGDSGGFQAAADGLLLGLAAAGLYDLAPGGAPTEARRALPFKSAGLSNMATGNEETQ